MIQNLAYAPVTDNGYPTSDGRPVAETDWHVDLLLTLVATLRSWFADRPDYYVAGNNFVFYEPGDKRRHVSPDVYMVRGVPNYLRPNFLIWEEGKGPEVVVELTSKSTRNEDLKKKFLLYQNVLRVQEYFLFDPREDYLDPSMQGYRLTGGEYRPIRPIRGRLPSKVFGLHLERDGEKLRLWDPVTAKWIPTDRERADSAEARADSAEERADAAEDLVEAERRRAETERLRAEAAERELERLRRELAQRRGDTM